MQSTVEPLEGNKVRLSVEVDENEFEKAVSAAFVRIAREVRVPGFRPGKAPRRVLEARIGSAAARQEAMREALPEYYVKALKAGNVDAIAQPEITVTGGEETGPVQFEATVEIRPSLQLEGYGGLKVEVPSPFVTDEDVDRQIDRMRSAQAELIDVERPAADGDVVTIDLKATKAHEDHEDTLDDVTDFSHEIGSEAGMPPEVDVHLIGAEVGQTLEFDATVGEGDDAAVVHFTITLKTVQDKQLPELTDEWVAESSELTTIEELRADLHERLQAGRTTGCINAIRDRAVDALVELVTDDVPEVMVQEEVSRRLQELDQALRRQGASLEAYAQATGGVEGLLGSARDQAVKGVKADLALRAVASLEELDATDADVDDEIEKLAPQMGQKPAQLRRTLERNESIEAVRSDVRKAKALDWVLDHVEVVDPDGNPIDRAALLAAQKGAEDAAADKESDITVDTEQE
jgi:trigger factor